MIAPMMPSMVMFAPLGRMQLPPLPGTMASPYRQPMIFARRSLRRHPHAAARVGLARLRWTPWPWRHASLALIASECQSAGREREEEAWADLSVRVYAVRPPVRGGPGVLRLRAHGLPCGRGPAAQGSTRRSASSSRAPASTATTAVRPAPARSRRRARRTRPRPRTAPRPARPPGAGRSPRAPRPPAPVPRAPAPRSSGTSSSSTSSSSSSSSGTSAA